MRSQPPQFPHKPTAGSRSQALRDRLMLPRRLDWEACEPRLVLSAQLLSEVIDPWQLQHHGLLGSQFDSAPTHALSSNEIGSAPALELQANAAHQQSGWNAVQQAFGLKGDGQTVAVIDSGIAWNHEALGKGFGAGYRVVGGWDFAENDSNPYDDGPTGFHGTHVSGIIGSDNLQTPGVAPKVDLVGLRVFNDAGQGQIQWVEQALSWVHTNRNTFENPITTVNLSLGTSWNSDTVPGWGTLEEELKQLYDDGIVVTASAGNAFKQYNAPGLSYPAVSSYVLPVASVDDDGSLSDFSQRSDRVLAAPGRNILSTVPDHVLGRDGHFDDFSTATGTSMAAPYMAGASVLVREAMEMVGVSDITPARIFNWLHDTADSVYDTITHASYDRLNLQRAIDRLIPDDNVGDTSAAASSLSLTNRTLDGWLNHLNDSDVYRFTANSSGQLWLDADSNWVDSLRWNVANQGQAVASSGLDARSFAVVAGQSYELRLSSDQEIGPFHLSLDFQASSPPPVAPFNPTPTPGSVIDLGKVDYLSQNSSAGSAYRATAANDGIFTVEWNNPDAPSGTLAVRDAAGVWHNDATWSDGKLRIDLPATAGQAFDVVLPGQRTDTGILNIVDVVQLRGSDLFIRDTVRSDAVGLDLSREVGVAYGQVNYEFQTGQINRIQIDGTVNSDQLSVVSSVLADKVDLRPGSFTLENTQLTVVARGMETVNFDSGAGAEDRLAMFDSDGDDTLTARNNNAELTGLGYKFTVSNLARYTINSTGQGQDVAYLYDSAGDDQLSVRPQFTSLWGDNYFVSVKGFERVFVYATQGGFDTANLYDSAGDDRFSTSGDAASIVGPGFHSSTKFFEQVYAHASAGGHDIAQLYGSSQQTEWLRGSDFVSFRESQWNRNAQGFERTDAFVNGLTQSIPNATALQTLSVDAATPVCDTESSPRHADDKALVDSSCAYAWASPDALNSQLEANDASVENDYSFPTDHHADLASQLLVEALDLLDIQTDSHHAATEDLLKYHQDPEAERELLDELFSRFS